MPQGISDKVYNEYLDRVRENISGKRAEETLHFMRRDGSYHPTTVAVLREKLIPGMHEAQPDRNDETRAEERKTPWWRQRRE